VWLSSGKAGSWIWDDLDLIWGEDRFGIKISQTRDWSFCSVRSFVVWEREIRRKKIKRGWKNWALVFGGIWIFGENWENLGAFYLGSYINGQFGISVVIGYLYQRLLLRLLKVTVAIWQISCSELAVAKKVTTFDRANSMRTSNPSFIAVVRPSYIDAACNLVSCLQRFCLKLITFFNGWRSFFFVLILWFIGEAGPDYLKFGREEV
jgi:hypothetical protein